MENKSKKMDLDILAHLKDLAIHGKGDDLEKGLSSLDPATIGEISSLDEIAGLAFECGLEETAIGFIEEKFHRGKTNVGDYLLLAKYATSKTDPERALTFIEKALKIDPTNVEAAKEKAFILNRIGRKEEADLFVNQFKYFPSAIRSSILEAITGSSTIVKQQKVKKGKSWNISHIHRFLELFKGREDVHARQWLSSSGNSGYNPVHTPISAQDVESHFSGKFTLGIYQLTVENAVYWIAFDIDIKKGEIAKALKSRTRWNSLLLSALNTANTIADLCAMDDIPCYIEYSGFKGYHVWIFLDNAIQAATARYFATNIVNSLEDTTDDTSIEIFPKQTKLTGKNLGNLIKLPLGIHLRTGKRSKFLVNGEISAENPFEFLFKIKKASSISIKDLVEAEKSKNIIESIFDNSVQATKIKDSLSYPVEFEGETPWAEESPESFIPDEDEELQHLLSHCPLLNHLIEKSKEEGSLSYDEQLSIVHTLGHLSKGVKIVNHYLGILNDPIKELFLKSRLKGNPASCVKLRARHVTDKDVDFDCGCDFGSSPRLYPNPLLHLDNFAPSNHSSGDLLNQNEARLKNMVKKFLDLREKYHRFKGEYQKMEDELLKTFEELGIDRIPTPMGTLALVTSKKGSKKLLLEL